MSMLTDRRAFLTQAGGAALALTGVPVAARAFTTSAPPRLRITDLGDLGGSNIQVTALNDLGVATGMATRHDRDRNGVTFKARDGQMVGMPWNGISTWGRGINNHGVIAGHDSYPWRVPVRGWVWSHNQLRYLSNEQVTATWTTGINDAGMVVGQTSQYEAFVAVDGEFVLIDKAPNYVAAIGSCINGFGDMAGYHIGETTDIGDKAFVRFGGQVQVLEIPGAYSHNALGLNDSRQVCGWLRKDPSSPTIAFVWQDGQLTLIPPLVPGERASSQAKAINRAGVVVGACDRPQGGTYAFMWQDGVGYELNKLMDDASAGWRLLSATAINNHGQIVGQGTFNGVRRAFLATPA
jgi:probable HAF family extracellular repeat protein